MKRLFLLMLTFFLLSCSEPDKTSGKAKSASQNEPFEVVINDHDYSLAYSIEYVLNEKELKIIFKGQLEGERDSTLYQTEIQDSPVLRMLSELNLDSLEEHLYNPCVNDGTQISVLFKKGKQTHRMHLSNYYHEDIGEAIQLINSLVPANMKIWYDKRQLLENQRKCQEGREK